MRLNHGCEENDIVQTITHSTSKCREIPWNMDYHEIILVILWKQASKKEYLEILRNRQTPLGDKSKWENSFVLSFLTIQCDL